MLEDTLATELMTMDRLRTLLADEQALLLRENNAADLLPLAREKGALCDRLAQLSDQREHGLRLLALPAGQEGIQAWLEERPEQRTPWLTLRDATMKARELNQINGTIVRDRLHHATHAIATLYGASRTAVTYGPNGQFYPATGNHTSPGI